MRNPLFLLFLASLIISAAAVAQNPSSPVAGSRIPSQDSIAVQDSLAQDWTTRAPLTEAELERRADNRAEVEDMKKRFRRFHKKEASSQMEEQTREEDANYLWSSPETAGQSSSVSREGTPEVPASENPEELKMEISRNLQQGRNADAMIPDHPVLPTYPTEDEIPLHYDAPVVQQQSSTPRELEYTIQSSLNAPAGHQGDWEAKAGIAPVPLVNPANGSPLEAGQIITLGGLPFLPNDSELPPSALNVLNEWGLLLKAYPGLSIEVRSHSFGIADPIMAQQITRERSENIMTYWLQQGVGIQQLSFRGYGNLSPLVPSGARDAQQKNERIELIILELPDR